MIQQVLAEARSQIRRYTPAEAAGADALIVDTRCGEERARAGVVPGSVHVPLSVLEWRADQDSGFANPHLAGRRLILLCADGYSSSLAAGRLVALGIDAADVDGGFRAWTAAGLECRDWSPASDEAAGLPGMGGPE